MEVNVNQKPDLNNFHHAYPVTVHGKTIGFLDKFYNLADLSTEPKIRNESGAVTAQPVQNVMPVMDNIRNTIETKKGIPSDPTQRGEVNFMPADSATPESKFYSSRIISAVENSSQGKANGSQWKATIKNSKLGVNQDEYALTRVEDLEAGKTYTKAEVLDYLRANEVVVKDVTFGGVPDGVEVKRKEIEAKIDASTLVTDAIKAGYNQLDAANLPWRIREGRTNISSLPDSILDEAKRVDALWKEWDGLDKSVSNQTTHFSEYTLPGAKEGSYREVLLTVPAKNPGKIVDHPSGEGYAVQLASGKLLTNEMANEVGAPPSSNPDGIANWVLEMDAIQYALPAYDKTSWRDGHSQYDNIPNPIVRLRTNERTTADGKRMLFIEEVQAPQKGQFEKMPALFQKNWRDIAFKWSLRTAADNGFDSVGWTTGEQQAARYDLSKQIDKLYWYPSEDGKGTLIASSKKQGDIINKQIAANEIGDYVGKEIAKRLLDAKPMETMNAAEANQVAEQMAMGGMGDETVAPHRLSGVDLKIGGEGLKKLYDQDFRNVVNNLPVVKKSGQKVEMVEIVTQDQKMVESPINVGEPTFERSQLTTPVHAINVTPEMRNASVSFMPADSDYLVAANSGDTKAAQQMVDQAAKAAGYTTKVWHGTASEFNEFKPSKTGNFGPGIYVALDPQSALDYAKRLGGNRVISGYAKIEKPITGIDATDAAKKLFSKFTGNDQEVVDAAKKAGFDAIVASGTLKTKFGDNLPQISLLSPSQIKSSDAITRDDAGNIIPLSQRFKGSNDIRFMPAMQFSAPESLPNGKVWRGESGYAIIQKEGGKFRVHSPIGLIGIAASYEAAEKMANKRNTK